jgi:branched-chain amino acid transport system substrate-binding protein
MRWLDVLGPPFASPACEEPAAAGKALVAVPSRPPQEHVMSRLASPLAAAVAALAFAFALPQAAAQKKYDPGASDSEIKIGQSMPYSGPASAYGTIGKVEAAYFRKINEEGGINGRKLDFISLDDGYAPPRTVEMTRRLVEQDEVLLLFQTLGTPSNTAIQKYMNTKKVPQLFVATGATKWNDPTNYPWTMGWQPNYQTETQIYAKHILQTRPNAKIGVLYQNDDFGKDYLKGLKDGLGEKGAKMLVAEQTYEVTDPTIDSQITQLHGSGADVFVNIATPKFAAQAIRKAYDLGWKPVQYLANVSVSVGSVLTPAGLDKSVGIISSIYGKDPTDPQWDNDPAMIEWRAFMKKYYPDGSLIDASNVYGYSVARTLVQVLKQCGDDLTRANVMKQAASLKNFDTGMGLPGITINTSATDFAPIEQVQLVKFDGKTWVRFGEVLGGSAQ